MFYYVVRALAKLYLMITHGLSAEGSEKVPESGPVILVANHVHANDPLALAVACKRPLHFMAKRSCSATRCLGGSSGRYTRVRWLGERWIGPPTGRAWRSWR